MNYFIESSLKAALLSLASARQLAFIIILSERMMPDLDRFAMETGFNATLYRNCVGEAWLYLAGRGRVSNYSDAAEQCLSHAPDTEEFEHPLISAALNAALSVGAMMNFLTDHNVDHIVEAAGLARDTVALYVQGIEAVAPYSLDFEQITSHPLVQRELNRQVEDLNFLRSLPTDVPQEMARITKKRAEEAPRLLPPERR